MCIRRSGLVACCRDLQQNVFHMLDKSGRSVGYPSDLEARKYLVLEDGDVDRASQKVLTYRRKKVGETATICMYMYMDCSTVL